MVYRAGIPPGTWHPFVLAAVELKQTLGQDLLVLLFDVNWVLLLINLVGLLVCFVGLIFTLGITIITWSYVYRTLRRETPAVWQ